ncbi:MAG: teichuronic acid biosynthesis glycosyltransferase TuaC [Clostridiales bacterium]|nr:teichuronic acid biosynthesis glycosyltransferase TuaC [Clostridiales bacterium]
MRVLILSHMYPNKANPVNGVFIYEQACALMKAGCEVKVVAPLPLVLPGADMVSEKWKKYKQTPKKEVMDGIEVYRPPYFVVPGNHLLEYSGWTYYRGVRQTVERIYRLWPFDIMHAHVALPDGYAAMLLKKDYKRPLVLSIHGQDMHYTVHRSQKARDKVIEALDNADAVIAVSNKLKREITECTQKAEVVTVPNGFNEDDVYEGQSPLKDKYKGKIVILSVGNLVPTKGHEFVLHALKDIIKEFDNIVYLIVGQGSYKSALVELVNELGLEPYVEFLGALPHKKAMEYMSACDIFALPSWQEGFGVVYLEAMAHGKPVIGCKGQGIEDFVTDGVNGILVEGKDSDSLRKAILSLIKDKQYATSMGNKAKQYVIGNLTWANNASRVVEIYNGLLNKSAAIKEGDRLK